MGGVRQFILALAVVLAIAAASTAHAVDVVGTTARLRWAPASGPVAAYAVWVIHQGQKATPTPSLATLSSEATVNGALGDAFQVQVAAVDARGVLGPRSPLSALIRFVAAPGPSSAPRLVLSTLSVSLTAEAHGNAAPVRVGISNGGGGSLKWNALGSARWLVLGPAAQGGAPGSLEIGAVARGLAPGRYHATVTVAPAGATGPAQSIQVDLNVQARSRRRPAGSLAVAPARGLAVSPAPASSVASASSFMAPSPIQGAALEVSTLGLSATTPLGQDPAAQSFTVRNAGSGTLGYQVTAKAAWLTVSPASGSSQGEADPIRVGISSAGLRAGTYRGSILVSAAGLAPASLAVTLVVSGPQVAAQTRPYDLDGDGHADLLARDASGAYEVTLLGEGGPIARSGLGATPPAGAKLAGSGDLDGDGRADLIWNDPSTGGLQLWLMNGARPSATRTLPLGGRSLLAIADFDGDGKADLLLSAGGTLELWRMDGLQVASITSGLEGLGAARVLAAADLDGNGRADLLVASQGASGTTYAALTLLGTRFVSLFSLPAPAASLAVVAAGPCGAGGAPGIIWRNSLGGGLVLWTLGRSGVAKQQPVALALPPEWELAATGDFSGDGRLDLLLRNGSTGPLVVLALDGPILVGGFQVDGALAPGLEILNR